eukprot:GHVN01098589.1.p1 GENE.GHVN01098589.1~~GHVN01098589.1.p1  ORF type:complete len:190 (+),score=15.33 GHVN01098589.1:1301-1870(+)
MVVKNMKWDFQSTFVSASGGTKASTPSPGGGYDSLVQVQDRSTDATAIRRNASATAKLQAAKLPEVAFSPMETIGQNLLMITINKYFMGGGGMGLMQIGYVLFSWGMLTTSLKLFAGVNRAFSRFDGNTEVNAANLLFWKLVYLLLCGGAALYQIWDLTGMGLVPIHSGDYVSYVLEKRIVEWSGGFLL